MRTPIGIVSAKRRAAARKHAQRLHVCPSCGKQMHGNGAYRHLGPRTIPYACALLAFWDSRINVNR
jgi:hypothetical protein